MHPLVSMGQQHALGFSSKTVSAQTVHLIPTQQHRRRVTAHALPSIRTKVLAPEFTAGVAAAEAPAPSVYPNTASASYASYEEEYRAMVLEQEVSLQHEADRLRYIMQKLQMCNNIQEKVCSNIDQSKVSSTDHRCTHVAVTPLTDRFSGPACNACQAPIGPRVSCNWLTTLGTTFRSCKATVKGGSKGRR
jgi:hypothetical protein